MKLFKKSNRLAYWEGEYDLTCLSAIRIGNRTIADPSLLNRKMFDYTMHQLECIKSVIRRIKKL